jgi:hypothetical protein
MHSSDERRHPRSPFQLTVIGAPRMRISPEPRQVFPHRIVADGRQHSAAAIGSLQAHGEGTTTRDRADCWEDE